MTAWHTVLPDCITIAITGNYRTVVDYDTCSDLWVAYHPALEGCIAQGETMQAALDALPDVRAMIIEHLRAHGLPVPPMDG